MFLSSGCVLTTFLTTYIADGNRPKPHKNTTFSVQAGMLLCFMLDVLRPRILTVFSYGDPYAGLEFSIRGGGGGGIGFATIERRSLTSLFLRPVHVKKKIPSQYCTQKPTTRRRKQFDLKAYLSIVLTQFDEWSANEFVVDG